MAKLGTLQTSLNTLSRTVVLLCRNIPGIPTHGGNRGIMAPGKSQPHFQWDPADRAWNRLRTDIQFHRMGLWKGWCLGWNKRDIRLIFSIRHYWHRHRGHNNWAARQCRVSHICTGAGLCLGNNIFNSGNGCEKPDILLRFYDNRCIFARNRSLCSEGYRKPLFQDS